VDVTHLGRLEEERRMVTVLFADLQGSSAIAEGLEPEQFRQIQASFFHGLARQIENYGGTLDKYIGDAVMAVFGAPVAHEDDPQRAVYSALAIQAEMERQNEQLERTYRVRLSLRVGVNTGEVVAGMIAGQSTYVVSGDAVNTAQRLESAAPPGGILAGETTYQLSKHLFNFERLEPLTVKSKSEKVPAYRVLGHARVVGGRDAPGFVGRGAELQQLSAAAFESAAEAGKALHIHGEPGVGKSRLLEQFTAALPGAMARTLARCASYDSATPYALVADFLRSAFGIYRGDDEQATRASVRASLKAHGIPSEGPVVDLLMEVLAVGPGSTLDPENKQKLLVSVLKLYVERRSAAKALLIMLEDVHWIDRASASALSGLVSGLGRLRCLLVSTSRDARAPWPAQDIALHPLKSVEAEELMDLAAAVPLPPELRSLVLQRTEGNPFFIAEVVRSLTAQGSSTVPPTVQEVLAGRLDSLSAEARRVAQRASIIGRSFGIRLLGEISGDQSLDRELAELEEAALVTAGELIPERTYVFRHALMHEVIYQGQLVGRRRRLHAEVGVAIERLYGPRVDAAVDLLAFHYGRSDDDAKALSWLVKAADRAKSLFANEEALAYYRSALERAPDGEGPFGAGRILERIGEVQTLVGRYEESAQTFRQALERIPQTSPPTAARLLRKAGSAATLMGAYAEAADVFEEAAARLVGERHTEAARIDLQVGQLHRRRGDYEQARKAISRAIELGRELHADDVVAEGLNRLGGVNYFAGHPKDAADCFREALVFYERLGDLSGIGDVRNNLGAMYRRLGRFDDALADLHGSLAIRQQMGNPLGMGFVYNNIGEVHRTRGHLREAVDAYLQAVDTFESIGAKADIGLALTGLGAARVELGEIEVGRSDLLRAEQLFIELGSTNYLPDLYRFLAEADLALGALDTARELAQRSLELARGAGSRHQEAMTQRVLGQIMVASGDRDGGLELLAQSRGTLKELNELTELARVEAVLARL
jgi:class 3 adenylate cyclase/tetratricopeptide (TPR) repeat protein